MKVAKDILSAFAVLITIFVVIILHGIYQDKQTKKALTNELINLPIPPNCIEKNRHYQSAMLVERLWYVRYSCQTTGAQAHDFIINGLSKRGYKEQTDYSKNGSSSEGKYVFYDFTYSSDKFSVGYMFGEVAGTSFPTEQKGLLEKSPVYTIDLSLGQR